MKIEKLCFYIRCTPLLMKCFFFLVDFLKMLLRLAIIPSMAIIPSIIRAIILTVVSDMSYKPKYLSINSKSLFSFEITLSMPRVKFGKPY